MIVLIIACALWSPWQYLHFNPLSIFGINPPAKLARLEVSSLAGEIEITIDGEKKGSVGPEGSPFLIEDVNPGQRLVKLVRKSSNTHSYITFEKLLNFASDIDTVIAYELGPTVEFSQGHVITAYKSYIHPTTTDLNITTMPPNTEAFLDGQDIGATPLTNISLDLKSVHTLKLTKTGYETVQINILPNTPDGRAKLLGYEINVNTDLFLIPIRVD